MNSKKLMNCALKLLPVLGLLIALLIILVVIKVIPMPLGSSIDGFSLIEGETNMGFEAKLKIAISQRDTAQYNYDTSVNTLEAAENEKKQAETDMSLAQERLRLSTVSVSDAELDAENLKMLLDEKIMRVKILEEESKSQ